MTENHLYIFDGKLKIWEPRGKKSVEEQYWTRGLHDAAIISSAFAKTSRGNTLTLRLDTSGALFDREVQAITFFGCEILSGDTEFAGAWWMGDELKKESGAYVLKLDLQPYLQSSIKRIRLRFKEMEVERNARDPSRYR